MQTTPSALETRQLFGLRFASALFHHFIRTLAELVLSDGMVTVIPVSVDVFLKSKRDKEFQSILRQASILTPDGMPIIWASRLLGEKIRAKISGSDLFPALCEVAAKKKYRLFFLGGDPGVAQKAEENLKKKYPQLNVVGTYSPPYGFERSNEENQKIVNMINNKKPDILFLALGAPKQEKWIWRYKDALEISIAVAVGASFDFISGRKKRAPRWMQKSGLEWFFRLCQEPKRLWKRYLIGNAIFLWLVIKELIKGSNDKLSIYGNPIRRSKNYWP